MVKISANILVMLDYFDS